MTRAHFSVKVFSVLAEALGTRVLTLSSSEPVSVSELVDIACSDYPVLEKYRPFFRVAVNLEYVGSSYLVSADDEVAILMPASGG